MAHRCPMWATACHVMHAGPTNQRACCSKRSTVDCSSCTAGPTMTGEPTVAPTISAPARTEVSPPHPDDMLQGHEVWDMATTSRLVCLQLLHRPVLPTPSFLDHPGHAPVNQEPPRGPRFREYTTSSNSSQLPPPRTIVEAKASFGAQNGHNT